MTTTAPAIADRYRLIEQVGRIGLGVVWHACDELLQRDVAVREVVFPDGLSAEECQRMAEQTLAGTKAVATLDTAAAVRVFDIVEHDGRPWVISELVRGRTLTEVLAELGALPSAAVARIGLCLLEALEAAHHAGLVHRDVKPSNVIISDDGRVALDGFGVVTDDATDDIVVGSPPFLAPERARGDRPSAEADFWAMAATLWTAAEGRAPYEGATARDVLAGVVAGPPPSCVNCTPPLRDLLLAMMAGDAAARPGPAEVRRTLEQVCRDGESQSAPSDPYPSERISRRIDRAAVIPTAQSADERTWPLVVALVAAMAVATVLLNSVL